MTAVLLQLGPVAPCIKVVLLFRSRSTNNGARASVILFGVLTPIKLQGGDPLFVQHLPKLIKALYNQT